MSFTFINTEILSAISYTLLHSLWQISLIALGIKLICKYKLSDRPNTRCNANIAAILMSIVAACFTFSYYALKNISGFSAQNNVVQPEASNTDLIALINTFIGQSAGQSSSETWLEWILQYNAYIALFWAIGVTILLTRIIVGWLGITIIKSTLSYQVPVSISTSFDHIKDQLKVNKEIRIALSKTINVPMVLGHLKPIVLLPLASINQLSIEDLEAIFVHELTHVIQNDYIKNLILMIGESVFFYHPMIWLLSSEIKEEREHICDDAVMKIYPDRIQYAKTLVKLQELFQPSREGLSLALFTNKFKLMNRVKRIMNINHSSNTGRSKLLVAALLMCSFVVFSSADMLIEKTTIDTSWIPVPPAPPAAPMPPEAPVFDVPAPPMPPSFNVPAPPAPPMPPTFDVPAPPAPPMPPSFNVPAPPAPPAPPTFSWFDSDMITYGLDTLDEEEREKVRKELKQKRSEMRQKARELQDEMQESREKIKEEYKADLEKKRTELDELKSKLGEGSSSRSIHFDSDEMSDEEIEEFAERIGEWGENFGEKIAAQFDEEWVEKMENWGESFGENFSEEFDEEFGEDWATKFEGLGEGIAEIFDEEWVEELTEMTEGLAEVFDEEWEEEIERMSEEMAEIIEERTDSYEGRRSRADRRDTRPDRRGAKESNSKRALMNSLEEDNLIKSGKNKITITNDKMTVNGTVQSKELLNKYQRIISRSNRNAFKAGKTKVQFNFKDNEEGDSSLSISIDN